MNSVLYHRYLKGESMYSETYAPTVNSATAQSENPTETVAYRWDLQETSKSLFPAFDYISSRLSLEGLSIHLIVSDQCPFVIPVWDLPPKSQTILCSIVRKACKKFDLAPSWMTALASLSKKSLPRVFEAYKADAYVVRRSMLQREVIYSSDGLTLLTIDHIYTLKQLLCTLSKKEWTCTSRESCLASCVHLLHRIHSVYTGKPASPAYIERVYQEIPFQYNELEEVVTEYNARYCTASICDVSLQPEYASIHLEEDDHPSPVVQELPDSGVPAAGRNSESWDEVVSPLDEKLDMVRAWEAATDNALTSPISVTYPPVLRPASSNFKVINNSMNKPPSIPPFATASQTIFPPPSSPPPSYPLPSPPSILNQRKYHRRLAPSSSSSLPISSITEEEDENNSEPSSQRKSPTLHAILSPSYLQITKGVSEDTTAAAAYNTYEKIPSTMNFFPPPPNLRDSIAFPLVEPSLFSDGGDEIESVLDDGDSSWELHLLDDPKNYIEVWSSKTEGTLCQRCHGVV